MNTTSRMESTGEKNRIQCSQETADLLASAGKKHWYYARDEKVHAKGKGELSTYWIVGRDSDPWRGSSTQFDLSETAYDYSESPDLEGSQHSFGVMMPTKKLPKGERLVDWMTDVLARLLTETHASRMVNGTKPDTFTLITSLEHQTTLQLSDTNVIDEVCEIIHLPQFNSKKAANTAHMEEAQLPASATQQLRGYVSTVAQLYKNNPFHNFEHARQVKQHLSCVFVIFLTSHPLKTISQSRHHEHSEAAWQDCGTPRSGRE